MFGVRRWRRVGAVALLFWLAACAKCDLGSDRVFEVPADIPLAGEHARGCDAGRFGSEELRRLRRANLAAVKALPVVDIHTHTFNARYLPLRNIALGKRDVHLLGILVTDRTAIRIANRLSCLAKLTTIDGPAREAFLSSPKARQEAQERDELVRALERVGAEGKGRGPLERCKDGKVDDAAKLAEARELAEEFRDIFGPVLGEIVSDPVAARFLAALVSEDGKQEERFLCTYAPAAAEGEAEKPTPIALFVSHAMDLAPTYAQLKAAGSKPVVCKDDPAPGLIPFSEQIRRMDHFQHRPDSRMLYFVGYNPFRPVAKGETHLSVIEDALKNHGAYGVKVYPPDGYRPALNRIPDRPGALFTKEPDRYWNWRYEVGPEHSGHVHNDENGVDAVELDRRLCELAALCDKRKVPMFVHCNHGEFEARKGYGRCMANPDFWIPILEKFPTLRLCLGHAGGEQFWFGEEVPEADWGRRVVDLCTRYPNVYCEFGVHDAFADGSEKLEMFVRRLHGLICKGTEMGAPYGIEEKVLYGSDWFMPRDGAHERDILHGYQLAFADPRLRDHAESFFATNALAYLDAPRRIRNDALRYRVPECVRAKLSALLAKVGPVSPARLRPGASEPLPIGQCKTPTPQTR